MSEVRLIHVVETANGNFHTVTRAQADAQEAYRALRDTGHGAMLHSIPVPAYGHDSLLDLDVLKREFAEVMLANAGNKWGMDAALLAVCERCYRGGAADAVRQAMEQEGA